MLEYEEFIEQNPGEIMYGEEKYRIGFKATFEDTNKDNEAHLHGPTKERLDATVKKIILERPYHIREFWLFNTVYQKYEQVMWPTASDSRTEAEEVSL